MLSHAVDVRFRRMPDDSTQFVLREVDSLLHQRNVKVSIMSKLLSCVHLSLLVRFTLSLSIASHRKRWIFYVNYPCRTMADFISLNARPKWQIRHSTTTFRLVQFLCAHLVRFSFFKFLGLLLDNFAESIEGTVESEDLEQLEQEIQVSS